ncbi:MAG: M16 family metallopeptidase [bacterium]
MEHKKLNFLGPLDYYSRDSGLTVILKQIPQSQTVSVQSWLRVGSVYEDEKNNGLAHFLEHMVFKGTRRFSAKQINSRVEEVGGYLNAATSPDYTYYYTTLPSEFWQRGLELLQQLVNAPLLERDDFEKERKIVLSELARYGDDPQKKLWKQFVPRLYGNHPYGRLTIGTEEVLNNVSHAQLLDFYARYYSPQRTIVVVSGNFPKEQVLEEIINFFDFKAPAAPEPDFIEPDSPETDFFQLREDVNQIRGLSGTIGLPVESDRALDLDVITSLLGGSRSSRLYENLVLRKKLATGINASYWLQKEPGPVIIKFRSEEKHLNELLAEINEEIERFKFEAVAGEELQRLKNREKAGFIYSAQTPADLAEQLGYWEAIGHLDFLLAYLERMEKITANDLLETANEFFSDRSFITGVVTPENKGEKDA